jgi:hypothetical protein
MYYQRRRKRGESGGRGGEEEDCYYGLNVSPKKHVLETDSPV